MRCRIFHLDWSFCLSVRLNVLSSYCTFTPYLFQSLLSYLVQMFHLNQNISHASVLNILSSYFTFVPYFFQSLLSSWIGISTSFLANVQCKGGTMKINFLLSSCLTMDLLKTSKEGNSPSVQ